MASFTLTTVNLSKSAKGTAVNLESPPDSVLATALSPSIRYLHVKFDEGQVNIHAWNKEYQRCGGAVLLSIKEGGSTRA